MRKLRAAWLRLGGWWGREGRERELREELEAHFQMHIDDNLRAGMTPAAARREAMLRFGGVESAKESVRAGWTVGFLETTRQDLVYAMRGLRRNPAFALTAILVAGPGNRRECFHFYRSGRTAHPPVAVPRPQPPRDGLGDQSYASTSAI